MGKENRINKLIVILLLCSSVLGSLKVERDYFPFQDGTTQFRDELSSTDVNALIDELYLRITIYDVLDDAFVDANDTAYAASWNGIINAPSMNVVYDRFVALDGIYMAIADYDVLDDDFVDGNDTAYAASWNGIINAPSMNVVYDEFVALAGDYLAIDGSNANQAIDIGIYDFNAITINSIYFWTSTTDNIAIGDAETLSSLTGTPANNLAIGANAMELCTTAAASVAIGVNALKGQIGGSSNSCNYNTAVGNSAGQEIDGGSDNTFVGYQAGLNIDNGADNTGLGYKSMDAITSGDDNTTLGWGAGGLLNTGNRNVFLGHEAGGRQTSNSDLLIIHNDLETSVAAEITNSLIYGVFNAAPASQTLRINAATTVSQTFESTGVATLADASLLKTSAAPTTDAMIANKKYVDDEVAGGGGADVKVGVDVAATADYIGAANSDGVLRAGTSLSYTDGGNFITLDAIQDIRTASTTVAFTTPFTITPAASISDFRTNNADALMRFKADRTAATSDAFRWTHADNSEMMALRDNGMLEVSGPIVSASSLSGILLKISGTDAPIATFTDTGASDSGSGAGMVGYCDDGAAMASGHRLGYFGFGGTYNATTTGNQAFMTGFATENWTATDRGADIRFETTANGATGRTVAVVIGQDGVLEGKLGAKLGDGGTSHYVQVAAVTGQVTLVGDARVVGDLWIDAGGLKAPGAKPAAEIAHGVLEVPAWQFGDELVANRETVSAAMKFPTTMDMSVGPTLCVGWSTTTIYTNDASDNETIQWQLEYFYTQMGESTAAAAEDTKTVAYTLTAATAAEGLVNTAFATLNVPHANDICLHIRLKRMSNGAGPAGTDTIADDVELHGIVLQFTKNKLGTAI